MTSWTISVIWFFWSILDFLKCCSSFLIPVMSSVNPPLAALKIVETSLCGISPLNILNSWAISISLFTLMWSPVFSRILFSSIWMWRFVLSDIIYVRMFRLKISWISGHASTLFKCLRRSIAIRDLCMQISRGSSLNRVKLSTAVLSLLIDLLRP